MKKLLTHVIFAFVPFALGAPVDESKKLEARDNFVWASVGDSWASGVSYSTAQHTDYDNDKYNCHRWINAYGALMSRDTTWTTNPQTFNFAACSGAILVNIFAEKQGDNPSPQMDQVGNPMMITYHAGGNNCKFGSVINDCIYQPPGKKYDPQYPDPSGACGTVVGQSLTYINKQGDGGLYQDELNTVRDLLGHPAVKDNKDFKLYMLSYAHFFNVDTTWCNTVSFAPLANWGGNSPKLTQRLRTDINDAVNTVNNILRKVADDVNDPRVKFIDISPAFNGHRFCEANHNFKDQFYNNDVWLWNLNSPANDPPADPSLMDLWLNSAELPDHTIFVPTGTISEQGSGGSTGDGPVWTQRPFHPKQGGNQAIKDIIIAQAKADKIPGIVGTAPLPPYAQGECSFHLTQWDNSWGGPIDTDWSPSTRYQVEVTMKDDSGAQIGYQAKIGAGNPSNGNPGDIKMVSKLEAPLDILPEAQGNGNVGYIAFSLPNQAWPSDQKCSENPHKKGSRPVPCCNMGDWDGSNTPAVSSSLQLVVWV